MKHILLTRGCDATRRADFNWDVRQVLMTRWSRLLVRTLSSGQDIPPSCLFPSLRKPQGAHALHLFNFLASTFTSLSFCVSSWEEERFGDYAYELGHVKVDFLISNLHSR